MDNGITNVHGVNQAAQVSRNAKTSELQPDAHVSTQKENGDKKLLLALVGLAATGGALVYGVKSGKLQKAVDALKSKFPQGTQKTPNGVQGSIASGKGKNELTSVANDALSQAKKAPTPYEDAFVGPLQKFDSNNVKPGTYIDGLGHKVTVDKYGTGIVDFGDGRFLVNNGSTQKLYDKNNVLKTAQDVSNKPAIKAADVTTEKAKSNINKTIIDSNGDEIIIDKYGTSILKRKDGTFQVTHGNEQKIYDSSNITAKSAEAAKDNIITRAEVNYRKAEKLLKEFEANPNDKKTYRQIAKLSHPDQYGDSTINATKEELSKLNELFIKATKINQNANKYIIEQSLA